MGLYIDRHDPIPGEQISGEDAQEAHRLDLEVQAKYGVRYLTALVDLERQTGFCIVDAPSKDAAEAVHREAHGMVASKIIELPGMDAVNQFLDMIEEFGSGQLRFGSALRTILFTDMEGSTTLIDQLGDEAALAIFRVHDRVVRDAVEASGGREIKHTGDGIMACFGSVVRAVECAAAIQSRFARHNEDAEDPIRVRIGLSAGEPVAEHDDLFGAAVNLAARICDGAEPATVLAPGAVRDLCVGKGFRWEEHGETRLRGFEEPVRLYRLDWASASSGVGAS